MSKRFTETDKWRDAWFRKLSPKQKCLWSYLCDNCDQSGVIDIDFELASFQIGDEVTAKDLRAFDRQLHRLDSGKLMIRGFIRFQYGFLSEDCKPHKPVFACLERHGISLQSLSEIQSKAIGKAIDTFPVGYQSLQEKEQDKEQDKDKEQDRGERVGTKERPRDLIFEALCEATGVDAKSLTKPGRGALNAALRDIRAASPDVTPDEVKKRAGRYSRKFSGAALTAPALAKHWASLGPPPMDDWTKQALANHARVEPAPEPQFDNSFAESLLADLPEVKAQFGIR